MNSKNCIIRLIKIDTLDNYSNLGSIDTSKPVLYSLTFSLIKYIIIPSSDNKSKNKNNDNDNESTICEDNEERIWTIQRRYSDFVRLRNDLVSFQVKLPPLPPKQGYFSFPAFCSSDEDSLSNLIEERISAFTTFIRFCVEHPVISKSKKLVAFLEVPFDSINNSNHSVSPSGISRLNISQGNINQDASLSSTTPRSISLNSTSIIPVTQPIPSSIDSLQKPTLSPISKTQPLSPSASSPSASRTVSNSNSNNSNRDIQLPTTNSEQINIQDQVREDKPVNRMLDFDDYRMKESNDSMWNNILDYVIEVVTNNWQIMIALLISIIFMYYINSFPSNPTTSTSQINIETPIQITQITENVKKIAAQAVDVQIPKAIVDTNNNVKKEKEKPEEFFSQEFKIETQKHSASEESMDDITPLYFIATMIFALIGIRFSRSDSQSAPDVSSSSDNNIAKNSEYKDITYDNIKKALKYVDEHQNEIAFTAFNDALKLEKVVKVLSIEFPLFEEDFKASKNCKELLDILGSVAPNWNKPVILTSDDVGLVNQVEVNEDLTSVTTSEFFAKNIESDDNDKAIIKEVKGTKSHSNQINIPGDAAVSIAPEVSRGVTGSDQLLSNNNNARDEKIPFDSHYQKYEEKKDMLLYLIIGASIITTIAVAKPDMLNPVTRYLKRN